MVGSLRATLLTMMAPASEGSRLMLAHCREILAVGYQYLRCERHRIQNRHHSKLKRFRDKSSKAQALEEWYATVADDMPDTTLVHTPRERRSQSDDLFGDEDALCRWRAPMEQHQCPRLESGEASAIRSTAHVPTKLHPPANMGRAQHHLRPCIRRHHRLDR